MATARTAESTKKSGFRITWWMILILVGVVALVGIIVLRFSRAATAANRGTIYSSCGQNPAQIQPGSNGYCVQLYRQALNSYIASTTLSASGGSAETVLRYVTTGGRTCSGSTGVGGSSSGCDAPTSSTIDCNAGPSTSCQTFDNNTIVLTKQFQSSKGLVADGIVGNNTWYAILHDCKAVYPCN